jgi:hypothetical protein
VLAKVVVRDGKPTKPPYQPNERPASHSDPTTWSTFAVIKEAYERRGVDIIAPCGQMTAGLRFIEATSPTMTATIRAPISRCAASLRGGA